MESNKAAKKLTLSEEETKTDSYPAFEQQKSSQPTTISKRGMSRLYCDQFAIVVSKSPLQIFIVNFYWLKLAKRLNRVQL